MKYRYYSEIAAFLKFIMPQIAANDKLKQRLFNNIISDKLSHAYIIEGAKGTGRHLLAKTIAKSLSCLNKSDDASPLPCGICENCRKIEDLKLSFNSFTKFYNHFFPSFFGFILFDHLPK